MDEWEYKAGMYSIVECKRRNDKFDCELIPIDYYVKNVEKEKWNDIDVILSDTVTKLRDNEIQIWCAGGILKCFQTYRGIVRRMECRCEPAAELQKEERDKVFEILKEYYEHEHRFPKRWYK